MRISKESLKGYILEEVLAYLIRNTGYKLLINPAQDPRDLERRGNGIAVRGRGAVHQVDVLGELKWIPAFTFPLRLIIEAKFRREKTGIDIIRNAIGVLLDVNQNNSPTREQQTFIPKYQYVYSIFSTSGFSRPAMNLAIAHQISLIDLSGIEYNELKTAIDQGARNIIESIERGNEIGRGQIVSNLRYTIRKRLETLPEFEQSYEIPYGDNFYEQISDNVLPTARRYNELFVGMANGPFMLLLKAENPRRFQEYAQENPTHKISITWSPGVERGRIWKIRPAEDSSEYELSFKLPEILSRWIFNVEEEIKTRAITVKQQYFSNITIYRYVGERDYLFRLMFDLENTEGHVAGW